MTLAVRRMNPKDLETLRAIAPDDPPCRLAGGLTDGRLLGVVAHDEDVRGGAIYRLRSLRTGFACEIVWLADSPFSGGATLLLDHLRCQWPAHGWVQQRHVADAEAAGGSVLRAGKLYWLVVLHCRTSTGLEMS